MKTAYVVESPITRSDGLQAGIARVYVATKARAQELTAGHPERTYRQIGYQDMPEKARRNLEAGAAIF